MNDSMTARKRLAVAAIPILFALFILLYPSLSGQEIVIDTSILFLIVLAVAIIILPWERLASFKAAGVELALDKPQVNKAINGLEYLKGSENVRDGRIQATLQRLTLELEKASGSRILWIDDTPDNVIGERRLFRVLGIETVMAVSSEMAEEYLTTDGDFDLIISDMRSGERYKRDPSQMPEAVAFIKELRDAEKERAEREGYGHIPLKPIIIYSGKGIKLLRNVTEPVRGPDSEVILANGVEGLFADTIRTLALLQPERIPIVLHPSEGTVEAQEEA